MIINRRFLIAAAVAGSTALTSLSAEAFFGPFSWMRSGMWGPGWGGWGGPWSGWGYPYYGYGWGYPYSGWGYPYYGLGYPHWGYPALAAPVAVTQPSSSEAK